MIARRGATSWGPPLAALGLAVVASCSRARVDEPRDAITASSRASLSPSDAAVASWTRLPFFTVVGAMAHATDAAHDRIVVYGGSYGRPALGRATETWSYASGVLTPIGLAPNPGERRRASLGFHGAQGVLFGGLSQDVLADTWSLVNDTWSQVATTAAPNAQSDAPIVDVTSGPSPGLLLVGYPGLTSTTPLLHRFTGTAWERVASTGGPTKGAPVAAYTPARGLLLLPDGDPMHTWRWDGASWTELSAAFGFTVPSSR